MLNENIKSIRKSKGLSQEELAIKPNVVRQTISKWENGETIPNTETLKRLSKLFDVSINTLLGSPRQLICQCCGMPLDDSSISKEPVKNLMGHSMKNTASGVTLKGNSHTIKWMI